ncbi:MAG: AlpA family phage regulatory protein [Gammaproteobacteria bacterium]|nr:AlpA family phage regulatory protein [Gammaproteobacteria bacterium]
MNNQQLLTRTDIEVRFQIGRSTIYRLMRAGKFPNPVQVGPRAVRWLESEINAWVLAQPRATGENGSDAAESEADPDTDLSPTQSP